MNVKVDMKKCMELVKEKSVQDFHNRNVEEKLRCLNVVRNLLNNVGAPIHKVVIFMAQMHRCILARLG